MPRDSQPVVSPWMSQWPSKYPGSCWKLRDFQEKELAAWPAQLSTKLQANKKSSYCRQVHSQSSCTQIQCRPLQIQWCCSGSAVISPPMQPPSQPTVSPLRTTNNTGQKEIHNSKKIWSVRAGFEPTRANPFDTLSDTWSDQAVQVKLLQVSFELVTLDAMQPTSLTTRTSYRRVVETATSENLCRHKGCRGFSFALFSHQMWLVC